MFVYCFGTWKNQWEKRRSAAWRGKIALQRIREVGSGGTLPSPQSMESPIRLMGFYGGLMGSNGIYHLVIWHSHGKSPCLIVKPSINGPFSMAMLKNQRVSFARTLRIKFRFEPPASDHCSGVQSSQNKVMAVNGRASDVTFCGSQAATVMSLLPSWYMRP